VHHVTRYIFECLAPLLYYMHSPSPRRFGEALCAQGIAVFMYDLVGHGRSDGERAFIQDYKHLVDDAVEVSCYYTSHSSTGVNTCYHC
jgi:hypothetical protein